MKRFIIRKPSNESDMVHANCLDYIDNLPENKNWCVEIKEYRKNRSVEQNAYLHGVALKMICDHTGYEMEDMKTYLCGEFTGWVTYEMMGQTRKRPQKRTHEMNTEEMSKFMEYIWWWSAEHLDLTIPAPNEG